jgi:hypothetical protein
MKRGAGLHRLALLGCASVVLLCHVAAGATNASAPVARKPQEFSPTISLFFLEDVIPFASNPESSVCIEQVKRASAFKAKRLNYVITWYFVDDDNDAIPEKYCYRIRQNAQCIPFTPDVLPTWEIGLQACIKYAVNLGFDIFYTPHVDDGGSGGAWRNAIKVDPYARHAGLTYEEMLLDPLTRIFNKVARPGLKIWYSLQGEMNLAIMTYPQNYSSAQRTVRQDILAGNSGVTLYTGIALNFNKLAGMDYLTNPTEAAAKFNVPAVRKLLTEIDFLGFSNYPAVSPAALHLHCACTESPV